MPIAVAPPPYPQILRRSLFSFGQALTRVYDLTLLSRSNVGSTLYDDLADLLLSLVDETKIERDYQPEVPNAEVYPVDYRIGGKGGCSFVSLRCSKP